MSEYPPPGVAGDASVHAAPALTPDAVSAVLADFRDWLTVLTAPTNEGASDGCEPPADAIDLHTLLGQFLAVRQEVNLQTRAVRVQQEQNAETLRHLTTALDTLQESMARREQMQQQTCEEATQPLLQTLVELYDALALAGRQVQRMSEAVLPALKQLIVAPASAEAPRSFWARWFIRTAPDPAQQAREQAARESSVRVQQLLASLVTGYTMSLQRIERALRQHELEEIPATGQRFDPERMEVVEAVTDSGRPAGEVLDEVRRGYLCKGRVFRYAQVRVAKS
jgi:molecular chaperone GrpE